MESRAEWFEVTEVFEGVEAKDVEAFMRVNNGGTAGFEFDPDRFVTGGWRWAHRAGRRNEGLPTR